MFDAEREDPDQVASELFIRWNLAIDGVEIRTRMSLLVPVLHRGEPCMLKIATDPDEATGMETLAWWQGDGAVAVREQVPGAILMERLVGRRSLSAMAISGLDDEATRVLCDVIHRLHTHQTHPLPATPASLDRWFAELLDALPTNELIVRGQSLARRLLASQRDVRVLHGDIHHENVLDGGVRGWLAIDPKGLLGERTFDYVNILRNPISPLPLAPGRFARTVDVISVHAGIERRYLLEWTLAFCALSAVWVSGEGDEPTLDLAIADLAARELDLV